MSCNRQPPPPPITNPEGVRFLFASTQAWMGVAETTRGQLAAAEGLAWFQLETNSPNTPFASVLPHVQSTFHSHASVQGHYTAARVAAATTDANFRMLRPMEEPVARRVAKGRITRGKTAAGAPTARTSEARCHAMGHASGVHYGIHSCEPYSSEIRMKFARNSPPRQIHMWAGMWT